MPGNAQTETDESRLAAAVGARICHDLANPLGAIANGADLIREIGAGAAEEELSLVEQSARRATALLNLHRLAFGAIRDPDAALSRTQLHDRIAVAATGPRLTLVWSAPDGPEVAIAAASLLALMVLAARAMLGGSGALKVVLPGDAALPAAVLAEGPRIAVTTEHRGWLRGERPALPDSRQVEFALIWPVAATAGAAVELIEEAGRLALRARPI